MIIGICGPAGSGKDTVSDYIATKYQGAKVALADPIKRICQQTYQFSDNQLWGPSEARNEPDIRYQRPSHTFTNSGTQCACCGDASAPFCYLTTRYALQLIGTEWGRHCFPDTWALEAVRISNILLGEGSYEYSKKGGLKQLEAVKLRDIPEIQRRNETMARYVLISDVRFRNEMNVIRRAGGKVWRVVPPDWNPSTNNGWRQHASEAEQTAIPDSEFDAVIVNPKISLEELYTTVDSKMVDFPSVRQI